MIVATSGARAKMFQRSAPLVFASLTLALVACSGDKTTSAAKNPTQAPADGGAPATAPAPEGSQAAADTKVKKVEGDDPSQERFALTITPPEAAAVGAEGTVKITIVPKEPWHMNLDYPTSLAVTPPKDVTLAKAELKKDDAVRLDEKQAEFGVAFTAAAAGDKAFTGQLKFAVCQDDACAPVTEEIQFRVAVR